jgi:formylglycine-generating enzyme required for sulfatase activity
MGSGNVVNVGPKAETPPSPAQTPPSAQKTPPAAALPRDELLILYNDARALQAEGKLSEAAALYAKLGDYRDAPDRLRKLQLYLEADKWMKQGVADKEDRSQPWEEARARLEELLQLDPRFLDAPARLETARRWLALPETYDLLLDAIDREDWKQALPLFEQIRRVKPAYRRTQPLFERTWLQMVQAGVTMDDDGKKILMVFIPAGECVMGSENGDSDEKPRHTVYLDAFYIDRYPVTNAEYKKFVEATKHRPPSHWQDGKIPPGKETHPVVNVSWDDAAAYAAWAGKRLPTEAEWEKAAGWDDLKKEQRVYPWGDRFDSAKCNSKESGIGGTTPVGKYSPQGDSFYGVADMAGNVWEWCADWYDEGYYKKSPKENPQGPASGSSRALRGGSWNDSDDSLRASNRGRYTPDDVDDDIGFRCARSVR